MFDTPEELQAYVETLPESIRNNVTMAQGERKVPPKKVLQIEEIQSDWHQAGRKKGYRSENDPLQKNENGEYVYRKADGTTVNLGKRINEEEVRQGFGLGTIPDAPFKKNWHELAMKRLLNYAADNGYDSIAITPGAEQAKRYDLSQHINAVSYEPEIKRFRAIDKNGETVLNEENANPDRIKNLIGEETAKRLFNTNIDRHGFHVLQGENLSIGGEGMKGFYDKMLPDYLNNFGKPYGAQVESTTFDVPVPSIDPRTKMTTTYPVHNFPITPEMRESIKQKGLPLYQQVGIPTAGAGAASQMLEPEEETGLAGGGSVAKLTALAKLKKMREEMAPRAAVVKDLMAKDSGSYLRDVTPDVLTKDYIEQEIQRMAARAEASKPEIKEAKGGRVRMTKNRDTMFMELSNKKLKRK
jgi:hypothetical protein